MISLSIFTVKPCFLRDQEGWQPLFNVTISFHISPQSPESTLYPHCNYESAFIPRVAQTRNPGTCSLPAWVWGALVVAHRAKVNRSTSLPRSCLPWVTKNKSCYLKVLTTLSWRSGALCWRSCVTCLAEGVASGVGARASHTSFGTSFCLYRAPSGRKGRENSVS